MASTRTVKEQHRISPESALAGILALLVDEREERVRGDKTATKTEALLAGAGLPYGDIAAVTGKKADAVRMAIQRGRAK
jgi:DNA-directed RNA polymerase specialized sigma24 family protein